MTRKIIRYENLPMDIRRTFKAHYADPFNMDNDFIRIEVGGKTSYTLPFETEEVYYLVKMKRVNRAKKLEKKKKSFDYSDEYDEEQEYDVEMEDSSSLSDDEVEENLDLF